jgi:hypothetical protein
MGAIIGIYGLWSSFTQSMEIRQSSHNQKGASSGEAGRSCWTGSQLTPHIPGGLMISFNGLPEPRHTRLCSTRRPDLCASLLAPSPQPPISGRQLAFLTCSVLSFGRELLPSVLWTIKQVFINKLR